MYGTSVCVYGLGFSVVSHATELLIWSCKCTSVNVSISPM